MYEDTPNVLLDALQPDIKPLKRYERGELTITILKIVAIGGLTVTMMALPGSAQILKLFDTNDVRERRKIRERIYGLEHSGQVTRSRKNTYKLTRKGETRLQRALFNSLRLPKQRVWDEQWRIVLFDIPNTKKRSRDTFSQKLRELGCEPIQKSVFVYPYPCQHELVQLANFLGIGACVKFITARDIPQVNQYKKRFALK